MEYRKALNRLCKWRTVLAGWQLGTRPTRDPECAALRDHRDSTLVMRAELSGLVNLLIDKGAFSRTEFEQQVAFEAMVLSSMYEGVFPGMKATDEGIAMELPLASQTMERLNFKR